MKNLDRNTILDFLKHNKELMREQFGVVKIGLIGSYSRNEQTDESDIDFLVEFKEVKYSNVAALYIFIENAFGKKPDIVISSRHLKQRFLSIIKNDIIYA